VKLESRYSGGSGGGVVSDLFTLCLTYCHKNPSQTYDLDPLTSLCALSHPLMSLMASSTVWHSYVSCWSSTPRQ
jgi:hypothetical protein